MIPIQKYHGEQDSRYGGEVFWPGVHGFPALRRAGMLKKHELESVPIVGQAHEKIFDLNDEEDRKDYNWVRDRIRNGLFTKDHEDRKWPDDKEWPIIYLEWTQLFALPKAQNSNSEVSKDGTRFTLR